MIGKRQSGWMIALLGFAFCVFTGAAAMQPVSASSHTLTMQWPETWGSPLGSRTVRVTAVYGALSKGCRNADTRQTYLYYMESGRSREVHLGVDLSAGAGTDVFAIGDGRILNSGELYGAGWGGVVLVEHFTRDGSRFTLAYGHVDIARSPRTNAVWRVDDVVLQGERIGKVARLSPPKISHLHIGLAPGTRTSVRGSITATGSGNCTVDPAGTADPLRVLPRSAPAPLTGSVVGWRNRDGSITSWQVRRVSGRLMRYWIPDTRVYGCVRRSGIDLGPMPARFLDQIPDRTHHHASC